MSDKTQNNEEIFVEDVEEENLVEDQELEQDTPEEVSEESQETLSDSILEVLLGEAKKKNEDEDEDEESDSEEWCCADWMSDNSCVVGGGFAAVVALGLGVWFWDDLAPLV